MGWGRAEEGWKNGMKWSGGAKKREEEGKKNLIKKARKSGAKYERYIDGG